MRKSALLAATALCGWSLAATATAQTVTIGAPTDSGSYGFGNATSDLAFVGQSFTTPVNATWLTNFRLLGVSSDSTPYTFTLASWDGASVGPALFQTTTPVGNTLAEVSFQPFVKLAPGQVYAFYAPLAQDASISFHRGQSYAGGALFFGLFNSGSEMGVDLAFEATFEANVSACRPPATFGGTDDVCATDATFVDGTGVDALGGTDTLRFEGATDYAFDTSRLGGDLLNFEQLVKTGSSVLTLSGTGGQSLPWSVDQSTLVAIGGDAIGDTAAVTIASGATLRTAASETVGSVAGAGAIVLDAGTILTSGGDDATTTFSGAISGAGGFRKIGNGVLTLSGVNTYTGGTTVEGGGGPTPTGALVVSTASLPGDVALANNGLLVFDQATNGTYAGVISGTGAVAKTGTGELTVTDDNTFLGAWSVIGGKLIGDVAAINQSVTVGAGTAVVFDQPTDATYTASINGAGAVEKRGAGTLTLDGVSNYDGGTTVGAGRLRGDGQSLQGAIVNNAELEFAIASGTETFAGTTSGSFGAISGSGQVFKTGDGKLIFGAANTYAGGTVISGGTLQLDHLGGAGSGLVQVGSGHLRFGDGGTFVNAWSVDGGRVSAAAGEVVRLAGAVTLLGDVRLGSGADTGTLAFGGSSASAAATTDIFVDGGRVEGATALSTLTAAAATTTVAQGATLAFGGPAEIRSLFGGGVVDLAQGLTLRGGDFSGVLSGAGGLRIDAGAGEVRLSGANTLGGAVDVDTGTLVLAGGQAVPDISSVSVDAGAGLRLETSETIGDLSGAGDVELLAGAILTSGGADADTTVSGAVTGAGGLAKVGTGTLTLTGANTYSGGTTVAGGTLAGTTDGVQGAIVNQSLVRFEQGVAGTYAGEMSGSGAVQVTGTAPGVDVTFAGANTYAGGTTLTGVRLIGSTTSVQGAIVADAASVVRFDQAGAGTYAGALTGAGSLEKAGAGELVLTGANGYAGGTTVEAGRLRGAVGALQGDVAVAAGSALVFDQGADATFAGALSGAGGLVKTGAGRLVLAGSNGLTGGTRVNAGVLQGTSANLVGDIVNDAGVVFAEAGSGTYAGVMSGTGTLTKTGAGTLTLTGANTYSGGTIVRDGVLRGTTNSLQGAILNDSSVVFEQSSAGTYAGAISGSGELAFRGGGSFRLTGASTHTGGTSVDASTLILSAGSLIGDVDTSGASALVFDQTTDGVFTGRISGSGALTKTGAGALRLSGSTVHAGGTTIAAGSLVGGTDALRGAISIADGARAVFDLGSDATFTGTLSGAGALDKTGAGVLTLNGAQALGGENRLTAGGLAVNGTLGGSLLVTGGRLTGTGTVGSLTATGGEIAPGLGVGTLTVAGPAVFGAGSTLVIQATPQGNDRIVVAGAAVLQGGAVSLNVQQGTYAPGTTWTFLTAGAPVSGTFGALTASQSFGLLSPRYLYGANSVAIRLELDTNNLFGFARTPNQKAAATGVAALPADSAVLNGLVYAPTAEVDDALDLLSGEAYAGLAPALLDDAGAAQDGLETRLRNRDADGPGLAGWAVARGEQASFEGDGPGVATLRRTQDAFLTGFDWTGENGVRIGAAFGGGRGEAAVSDRRTTAETEGWQLAVYGALPVGPITLRAGAGAGGEELTLARTAIAGAVVETLRGETEAGTRYAFVEAAHAFDAQDVRFEAFAGLRTATVEVDGFRESGGSAALIVGDGEAETTAARIGLRADRSVRIGDGVLKPHLGVAWEHGFEAVEGALRNRFVAAESAAFDLEGVVFAQDRALLEAGVSWEAGAFKVDLSYAGSAGDDQQRHGGRFYVRMAF